LFFADFEDNILILIPKAFISIDYFGPIACHNIGPCSDVLVLDKEPNSK